MSKEEERKIDQMIGLQQQIRLEVSQISRALYGDRKNKVIGYIEQQQNSQIEIAKLKLAMKRFVWMGAGAFVVIQIVISIIFRG